MNLKELQEEAEYLKSELAKEFEQMGSAVDVAQENLVKGKTHRLLGSAFLSRAGKITELIARIATLEKVITMLEKSE